MYSLLLFSVFQNYSSSLHINLKEKWKKEMTQRSYFFRKIEKRLIRSLHKGCYLSISNHYRRKSDSQTGITKKLASFQQNFVLYPVSFCAKKGNSSE